MTRLTLSGKIRALIIFGAVISIVAVLVFNRSDRGNRVAGHARLVSVQPLSETDGEMCQWIPAHSWGGRPSGSPLPGGRLARHLELIAEKAGETPALPETQQQRRAAAAKRRPVRVLHDSYAAYSAVAVDPTRNEVVMTDENLFSILVYDRLENTLPKATMSEPKRIIQGLKTEIEFQCSLYVDPANGDIYAVNNDTVDKLVIFSRQARGETTPDRTLETPHTTYGIAVDEKNQEMLLTIQDDSAVVTFRKTAKGNDPPVRTLQGERTLLADPHGIALDPRNDLVFVSNWGTFHRLHPPKSGPRIGTYGRGVGIPTWPIGRNYAVAGSGQFHPPSITVYARNASGDTVPLRVIQGAKTQLNWPSALAIDPERGELYVANDPSDSILVFRADASGDVAPLRVLQGPKTLLRNPTGLYLDVKNNELWVANFGNHTATVYQRGAAGDRAPLRVIRSAPLGTPAPMMGNPFTVVYDSKRDELLVAN